MSHASIARSVFVILAAVAAGMSVHAQTPPPPAQSPPKLPVLCGDVKDAKEVSIVIDPGADSGTAQIEFCNPDKTGPTLPVTVSAKQFTSRMTRMPLAGRWLFSQDKSAGTDSIKLDPIPINEVRIVKVEISQIWEAGEAEAPLDLNGMEVAKLVSRKYRLPFGVKIDAPNPDQPELTLERGKPLEVVLRNTDGVTYLVDWEFRVEGVSEKAESPIVVSPNATARVTLNAKSPYFSGWPGLLGDHAENAYLTLSFRPPGVANAPFWPSKVITVKAHLRSLSENSQLTIINPLLIIILVLGALASYVGSVSLPNRVKRSERRERLSQIAQRLGSISHAVDSRLRVAMRVQRKRLVDVLHSRKSISADLANVLNQVADGTTLLEQQIALAERIDAAHRRLKYLDVRGSAPSALADAEALVWKAADEISQVCPEASKMQRSKEYLDEADARMNEAEVSTDQLAADAAAALVKARARIAQYTQRSGRAQDIANAFPDLLPANPNADIPNQLDASDTETLDRKAIKIDLLREFIEVDLTAHDEETRAKLDDQWRRLVRELPLSSYQAVRRARLLVREAQEGIYPEDLAVRSADPQIRMDPASPLPNDPVTFSVRFSDSRLNDSAARLEYEGRWSFGHDDFAESGWELVHYFPRDGEYDVRFAAVSGTQRFEVSKDTAARSVKEKWVRDRNQAELLRFAITLVPAIIGLLSGAREQFLKMDPWAATFAVFMLGFGSDTVKNLVSQTQPAPAKPAPAPATPPASSPTVAAPTGAQKPATTL